MTSNAAPPDEFALIARYFSPLAKGFPGAFDLLDDAAVMAPAPGHELILKTDVIVAGVDFPPDQAPNLIAAKALRVNLSDLAAKGAVPRGYLLDLVLPKPIGEQWIAAFSAGLAHDQREFAIDLIGGDMSSTPGPVTVAVTAIGEAPIGGMIRRNGARPGDVIFVTGTIGDAALGLAVLQGALSQMNPESAAFLLDRYNLPRPKCAVGPRLRGIATAAIDISDGLVADLGHICAVSGASAVVEGQTVPFSVAARAAIAGERRWLASAITGGDDYEILFTAPAGAVDAIRDLSRVTGTAIAPIGRITASCPGEVTVLDEQGRPIHFSKEGWTHFSRA